MPAIEIVGAVHLLADLLALRDARVHDPRVAVAAGMVGLTAVDVDRGKQRQLAAPLHDDAEVVIRQRR